MKLAGKVLVVTGAGSGIARAVTLEAVRRSARVAAVDLNTSSELQLGGSFGRAVHAVFSDYDIAEGRSPTRTLMCLAWCHGRRGMG